MDDKRGKSGAGETREARLKAALKANIAKRKAQAKARDREDEPGDEQE
ncbi:hypothetical protein [Pelagovum pacificum]|nr:hypothetical protein [Pelagovum pacificum]QQA43974.1 hypothetical protein I8N54_05185 [Pelagovum pacificum]